MPIDSMLGSAAVVAMFVIFAGALIWGERQTNSPNRPSEDRSTKRRSF
jgi:hypothetical protein